MKTITTKSSKSGATLWYVDGKRTSRDKAVEADIANGREKLSKLLANLTVDGDTEFAIYVEFNLEIGGRCHAFFNFTDADKAVEAAKKIVALGTKQVHRVVIDNGRPYPENIRYADTNARGKLIFLNGFERFDETAEAAEVDPVEYAVTEDAFNFAVDCEIGLANLDKYKRAEGTFTHRVTKTGRHIFGGAYGFLSTDEVNERLGRYGLTVEEFLAAEYMWEVASDARMSARLFTWNLKAKIRRESKPLDEDVFNLIPTVDELNDVDDGTESDTVKLLLDKRDDLTKQRSNLDAAKSNGLITADEAAEVNAFDKAVKDSIENYGATLEVNGETLTFEDGLVIEVGSTRYEAYFTIRNGRKNFYYRGNRVSKQDFFGHIETEDKALDQRAAIGEFVARHGGSEIKPGINPQGNFVAQLHPTLANGRQDNYFATFDTKDAAHAFIAEFKTLAGDMQFLASIKRGSFYGEVIYRHGLKGQEFFATDEPEIDTVFDELDEIGGDYRALHKRIYGVEEQADDKVYPIDIAIYHGGSTLTGAELEDAAAQFRTAITANGNFGKVEVEKSYLSVIGDIGGDNKTIWKLIGDLCWRGDCVLESWDAEWPHELREMPGIEIDALLERMGIDNEPLAFEIPAYDAAVKKIFGSDAPAIFTPGGHLTVEVAV